MPRPPRQGPPVDWAEFAACLAYLRGNEADAKAAFRRATRQHDKEGSSFELIGHIADLWKSKCGNKRFELALEEFDTFGTASTIRQLISYANRYLAIVQGNGHLSRQAIPCLTIGNGVVRCVWVDQPRKYAPEDHERRFNRVYYLYREWRNTAQDDIFRGFIAMAEALGIEPVLRRFPSNEAIADEVVNIVTRHEKQNGASDPISIILALEGDPFTRDCKEIHHARQLARGKLFLTRTEFDDAHVHQNNDEIGCLIARGMTRDLASHLKKHPHRNKVLLIDADLGLASSFYTRKHRFEWQLERMASSLAIHESRVPLDSEDFYSPGVVNKVHEGVASILRKDRKKEIIAIYAGYFTLTWGTILAARESRCSPEDLHIYSEDIIYALIRELGKPDSCLRATCGVDPYHYGRYLLRFAATRSQDDDRERATPPQPFLITKDDVTFGDTSRIGYTYELSPSRLSFHADQTADIDIRLEGEQFAWKPWMRQCIPHAYGPDLVKARRFQAANPR